MKFSILVRRAACAALAALLYALLLPAQSSRPITYKGLVDSLKTRGLTNAELAKIIKSRGVDFELTWDKESELKAAGADTALLAAVRANYHAASATDKTQPSESQPPASPPPSSPPPAPTPPVSSSSSAASKPAASSGASAIKSIRDVKKLYIEKMSNDLDEFIKSEISRQMPGRLLIVLRPEDADAVMKGGSTNRHGNVTITDLRGTAELWAGEAGDKGIYLTKIHGGEKKVAERLVSGLKKALQ